MAAKLGRLLVLVTGVSILNIIVWSPGLAGLRLGGSALETALGITLMVVSLLALLYASYSLLVKAPAPSHVRDFQTPDDYASALAQYRNVKVLRGNIELAVDQLERLQRKKAVLSGVLTERFDPAELSYRKFASVIGEVEKLFYLNVRGILNKLGVFDASEFARFASKQKSSPFSTRLIQEKTDLYQNFLAYMAGYIGANEEILLKLDKLLLEISLLGSADYREIDDMPCMKEIDALIKQTKFYNS